MAVPRPSTVAFLFKSEYIFPGCTADIQISPFISRLNQDHEMHSAALYKGYLRAKTVHNETRDFSYLDWYCENQCLPFVQYFVPHACPHLLSLRLQPLDWGLLLARLGASAGWGANVRRNFIWYCDSHPSQIISSSTAMISASFTSPWSSERCWRLLE